MSPLCKDLIAALDITARPSRSPIRWAGRNEARWTGKINYGHGTRAGQPRATLLRIPRRLELIIVVFKTIAKEADWKTAIPSKPFYIEDDVKRDADDPFRVTH
jgi:hypothetical protein